MLYVWRRHKFVLIIGAIHSSRGRATVRSSVTPERVNDREIPSVVDTRPESSQSFRDLEGMKFDFGKSKIRLSVLEGEPHIFAHLPLRHRVKRWTAREVTDEVN